MKDIIVYIFIELIILSGTIAMPIFLTSIVICLIFNYLYFFDNSRISEYLYQILLLSISTSLITIIIAASLNSLFATKKGLK